MRLFAGVLLAMSIAASGIALAPPAAAGASGPAPIYHGSRSRHVVALTFDDGWSASATTRIFRILAGRGVAATFFPYAVAVTRAPSLWREIAAAGYPIGDHTKNHPDLTSLPDWRVRAELETARTIIEGITGRPMLRVFRPPFGAWDAAVQADAAGAGFGTDVLWDVDAGDASLYSTWASVYAHAVLGTNGSIVLMHAGPAITPEVLDAVISSYESRGFGFVTIPELLGSIVAPWPGSPGPTPAAGTTPGTSPAPGAGAIPWASLAPEERMPPIPSTGGDAGEGASPLTRFPTRSQGRIAF